MSRSTAHRGSATLWRSRDYMLLWSGQGISVLGGRVSGIAFPLLVLALTHSPAQAGFVSAVSGLPYLVLSLPAGVLVDRWNRKRVMIVCDALRAINFGSIPVIAALAHLTVLQLYINAAVEGILFVLFNVAEVSSLSRLVPKDQLASASAQNEAAANISALAGPPFGGLIFQVLGKTVPFLVDAVSYAASVFSLALIKTPLQTERPEARPSIRTELREGVSWFWRQPLIRLMAFKAGGSNFVFNGTYLILIVVARQRHAEPALIGAMLALGSVGGLLGTLIAPRLQRRFGFGAIVVTIQWIEAAVYPLFAIAPNVLTLGLVYAALVVVTPTSNAVVLSYRLALIPDHLQGRVNSAVRLITYGSVPLGTAVAGILLQAIGGIHTILVYAGIMVVLAILTTATPQIRNARPLAELPEVT